jgi:hypothetical protein
MAKSVILSERTKPRALEQMKAMYAAHSATCSEGENCRVMVKLKADIEAAEKPVESKQKAKTRSVGVK